MELDRIKVRLDLAAQAVTRTIDWMEEGGDPDGAIAELLGDVLVDVSNSVDRRIALLDIIGAPKSGEKPGSGLIGKYKDLEHEYRARAQQLENIRDRVKASTMQVMKDNPNVALVGSLGKFRLQNNPDKLETVFERHTRDFRNIVYNETVEINEIPARFLIRTELLQLNTEELTTALKAGETFTWAAMTKGQHLRVSR